MDSHCKATTKILVFGSALCNEKALKYKYQLISNAAISISSEYIIYCTVIHFELQFNAAFDIESLKALSTSIQVFQKVILPQFVINDLL